MNRHWFAVLALVTLAACSRDNPLSGTAGDAAIGGLVGGVPDYPVSAAFQDSSIAGTDTVKTSRTDSINNLITDTTWQEQTIHVSAADNPDQFMMFDPQASVLWPGNLVQGNSLATGIPTSVPIADRAPATVYLDIVSGDSSGATNQFYRTVAHPSGASLIQAQNEILAGYHGGTAAKYSYSMEQVYSATQLNFTLGFGYSGPAVTANGTFGFQMSNANSRIAVRLTQQYFTMVMNDPQGVSGVFGPSVHAADLEPYVGPGNPLCYISSVTYGRVFILLYESTASAQQLSQALSFAYSGGVASGSITDTLGFDQVMSQTTVSLVQIGGNGASGLMLSDPKNFGSITNFLSTGADFSPTNVGAPISFTVKYLRDASLVRMSSTMEYDYIQRTPLSSSTAPTAASFSISVPSIYIPNSTDPGGGDGGVRVDVRWHDDSTGADSLIWTSPTNNYDATAGRGWWDFGQDAMKTGTTFFINWIVPTFTVPNSGRYEFYLILYGNEYDASRDWRTVDVGFIYDQASHKWVLKDQSQSVSTLTMYGVGSDTDIQFDYQIRVNGQQMQ